MSTEFVADAPPPAEPTPIGVKALPPLPWTVAGVEYTFRCPKLAMWAELAIATNHPTPAGRAAAIAAAMMQFLHAALPARQSEELHQRKLDPDDELDLPDLAEAFAGCVDAWQDKVSELGRRTGLDLDVRPAARPVKRAPAKARRR